MTEESPDVRAARFEVERSLNRLVATFDELQRQFAPHAIMREAWETARDKGADLAESAVDAVARRPVAATSVVAAIALFLAREPLMDLAGKATKKVRSKTRKKARTKPTENVS